MARTGQRVGISFALTIVLLVGGAFTAPPAHPARPGRPDIIVVVTDDQRRGTLGWLPEVNNYFVRHGVRFSRAMVPTSLCCPSRASLLTGEYSHTTKVWSNEAGWRRFVGAGMESKTVAVWLRRSGYRTGLVGKYLNAYLGNGPAPGWTVWHAFTGSNADYYNYELIHTNGSTTRYGSAGATYSTDVLRRYALRFIENTPSDKPLFLYFSPYAPHDPATPAPRHLNLAAPIGSFGPPSFNETDLSDKPLWIRRLAPVSSGQIQDLRVRQYRSLRSVDEAVGAILDVQRARNRLRNTLLVFVSDNGVMWGEHRVMGKFVPYSGATRIPLAIAWPARLPQGRVDARLALNIDVPVTIAAAAEAAHDDVAGRNLLLRWKRGGFVLEASAAQVPGSNGTNVARPAYCGWRTGRYLFVHYGNGREELYDYVNDPWELRDRRGTAPALQASLRGKAREACRPVPPGFSWG
ncbi:MAG TPA: sulfatase [Actinomycetota bacterium]|nr:sulfatase [Actinomycetota bacterium]